jgi:hypothetical protein
MKFESSPFIWGIIASAVILPIVSFSAGWIVTTGYANEKADQRATKAVTDRLATICVAQFPTGEDGIRHLAALKAAGYSDKGSFVSKNGWATMPGTEAPRDAVAKECAERLLATVQ